MAESIYADFFYEGDQAMARAQLLVRRKVAQRSIFSLTLPSTLLCSSSFFFLCVRTLPFTFPLGHSRTLSFVLCHWFVTRAQPEANFTMFRKGMKFGLMLTLFFWMLWDSVVDANLRPSDSNLIYITSLPIYRFVGCCVLLAWCWGLAVFVWTRYRVNWTYILELDPSEVRDHWDVWDSASSWSILFFVDFILYYKLHRGDFPLVIQPHYVPIALVIACFLRILWFLRPRVNG